MTVYVMNRRYKENCMEFYLSHILERYDNTKDKIAAIIHARGFLLEKYKGEYYLSDNAQVYYINDTDNDMKMKEASKKTGVKVKKKPKCEGDAMLLNKLMKKHNLGKLIYYKDRIKKSYRPGVFFDRIVRDPVYSIVPHKIKLSINDDATVEDAINLFNDKQDIGGAGETGWVPWYRFALDYLPPKICVSFLEAYIAYYAKAISACGVYTCFSCDGNHDYDKLRNDNLYVLSYYPYSLWHRCIWDCVVIKKFGNIAFIEDNIFFTESEREKTYQTIYEIADFLYANRVKIRNVKYEVCKEIRLRPFRKNHSEEELKDYLITECSRLLNELEL